MEAVLSSEMSIYVHYTKRPNGRENLKSDTYDQSHGHALVYLAEALSYKPEGCGSLNFSIDLIFSGAGTAQSVYRLAAGWTTEGSEFKSQ
jgi:hypothetical protein